MSLPIGDYALIGDTHTTALVSSEGSIDWWCWARHDAPALLTKLLDDADGGYAGIALDDARGLSRAYLPGTNILETRFAGDRGEATLTDFMALFERPGPTDEPDGAFWRVGVLALAGQTRPAWDIFERLLERGNDVGLFAEEIDAATGEQRGNFPQGFTRMAIVDNALRLERCLDRFGCVGPGRLAPSFRHRRDPATLDDGEEPGLAPHSRMAIPSAQRVRRGPEPVFAVTTESARRRSPCTTGSAKRSPSGSWRCCSPT